MILKWTFLSFFFLNISAIFSNKILCKILWSPLPSHLYHDYENTITLPFHTQFLWQEPPFAKLLGICLSQNVLKRFNYPTWAS